MLRIVLTLFMVLCVFAGVGLGYFRDGGPLWLAVLIALVMGALVGGASWIAAGWGEREGRKWRD